MNVRLRVLAAVAATAVLGMMGAVAAVPASASVAPASASVATTTTTTTGSICSEDVVGDCLESPTAGNVVYVTMGTNYAYETDCSAGTTYNGEDYCEVKESGTNVCLEYDHTDGNLVVTATCSSSIASQDWWYSGTRFRNLYATEINQDACLNLDTSTGYVDVYSCSVNTSTWAF
jgi:hypothetical protein